MSKIRELLECPPCIDFNKGFFAPVVLIKIIYLDRRYFIDFLLSLIVTLFGFHALISDCIDLSNNYAFLRTYGIGTSLFSVFTITVGLSWIFRCTCFLSTKAGLTRLVATIVILFCKSLLFFTFLTLGISVLIVQVIPLGFVVYSVLALASLDDILAT
jgi:hypothetical protein